MFDFSGQVVLITGATGALGEATARAFLAAGATLVLADRNPERQRAKFPELTGSEAHLLAAPVKLDDPASVQPMVDQAIARFGRIDVLVNTVGGYRAGKPVHATPLETFDHMVSLNARTVFVVCQAVIPQMQRQKQGRIVNVAGRAGLAGSANAAAYSAAKSAVIRITESMAAELRDDGVPVNCILPGTIDTPQNRQAMPKADHSRWVQPASLAEVICFLASPAARDISGAALPVYGKS